MKKLFISALATMAFTCVSHAKVSSKGKAKEARVPAQANIGTFSLKQDSSCHTDGCTMSKSGEMRAAMDFASSMGPTTVLYITEIKRIGEGMFKVTDNDGSVNYLKTTENTDENSTVFSYKVSECYNSKRQTISCTNLQP
jgi:hypothetical protein